MKSYKTITKDSIVTDVRNVEVVESDVKTTSNTTTLTHVDAQISELQAKINKLNVFRSSIHAAAKTVKLKVEKEEVKKHV
ncbi:MAG: hypothetical protein ACT6FG_05715 [Methanosarcinaceae archaeon]